MKLLEAPSRYADQAAPPMKRLFRIRDGVAFLLVLLGTLLSYRAAIAGVGMTARSIPDLHLRRHGFESSASINSTLLRIASLDEGEPDLKKEIEQLADGTFLSTDPRYRTISAWRRISIIQQRLSPKIHPQIRHVYPQFRRALRDWARRRRFHPGIISQLVDLVKLPIDGHQATTSATPRKYGSCAVVGNSGILMRSERGTLIDEHDLVIRLNNARILGFRKNVGSKTGISFVNSNILHLCARKESCFCHPYGDAVPIVMYICQAAHFVDYVVCNSSHRAPLIVTDPRFDLLCARMVKYYSLLRFVDQTGKSPQEWGKFHDGKAFHYSSGMQAVMLAVGICGRVSIFGFGKAAGVRHHYHTNQKAELSLHDYEAEYLLYRDLIQRPNSVPFLAESGFRVPPVVAYD